MTDQLVPGSQSNSVALSTSAPGTVWLERFDIRAEVRRLLRSGHTNADEVANLVMGFTPVDAAILRRALRDILTDWVRLEQSRLRIAERQVPVPPALSNREKRTAPDYSSKIEKSRALALKRRMDMTVHDPVVGGQKMFRDCTEQDLRKLAEESKDLARANMTVAKNYLRWADAVRDAHVRTVGELPAEIVEELCQR